MGARERRAGPSLTAARLRLSGFSLLELVVVIVLVSVLLAVAVERLLLMKARAESAAMDQVVGSLRSAMTIRIAELLARNRPSEIAAMVGSNPMLRLAEPPSNYLGELFGPDPATLQPGNWYFDTREHVLMYLVDSSDYFESPLDPPRARFAIQPVFEDTNGNGRYDAGIDLLQGLRLAVLGRYDWKVEVAWPDWPLARPKARGARPG